MTDYHHGFADGMYAGSRDWESHVAALNARIEDLTTVLQDTRGTNHILAGKFVAIMRALGSLPAEGRSLAIAAIKRELATSFVQQLVAEGCDQGTAQAWADYEIRALEAVGPETNVAGHSAPPHSRASRL